MKKNCFLWATVLMFLISPIKSLAQCPTDGTIIPLPKMFVKNDTGNQAKLEFGKYRFLRGSKYGKLNKYSKVKYGDASPVYTFEAVKKVLDMIIGDPVRVHFAKVSGKKDSGFETLDNNIVLLFASSDILHPKEYYLIKDSAATYTVIPAETGEEWIKDFATLSQKNLKSTLRRSSRDNYPDHKRERSKFSDTKSLLYSKQNLIDAFFTEQQYQKNYHLVDLVAVRVIFSAYDPNGRHTDNINQDTNIYRRKLYVQFAYLEKRKDGGLKNLDVEDQNDYKCRVILNAITYNKDRLSSDFKALSFKELEAKDLKALEKATYTDTGLPCPPNRCN